MGYAAIKKLGGRFSLARAAMSKSRLGVAVIGLVLSLSGQTLKKVAVIDLPDPKGERFDYLTMDQEDHYLLSAHLGPGILNVIDVRSNKLVGSVSGVPGITGLVYVPGLHKVYTSDWGEQKIGVVDLHSMKVLERLPTADKPNGSTYAVPFRKVYVSDTVGRAVAVVDVEKDQIVKTLFFDSETGMPEYDSVGRRVYVNLRSVNQVAEIDPSTDGAVRQYPVAGCTFNHGMAMDAEHRRASLLCGRSETLTVFALDTHRAIANLPLAAGADVVRFDPGLRRIYAACSIGVIAVYQEDDADHFRKLEDFPVQKLVHSLEVNPATHRVYVPEQEENGKPVARIVVYEAVAAEKNY